MTDRAALSDQQAVGVALAEILCKQRDDFEHRFPTSQTKIVKIVIPLKNPMNASTKLSMNGKSPMI